MIDVRARFDVLSTQKTPVEFDVLASFYAELEAVNNEEIMGNWRGGMFKTGKLIDLTLKDYGVYSWVGKNFISQNKVKALMHQVCGLRFNIPLLGNAQVRQVEFRGKVSVGMIYNHLPIIDYFRRVDETTLMGVMDYKGRIPLYFYLYK